MPLPSVVVLTNGPLCQFFFNIRFQNVEIFLLNIAGKSALRADFPAILPRREAIFLLYLAGKSILRGAAGKSALRADFLLPDFPAIFSRKIGPSDRFLPRSPKIFLLYLAGKRRKIALKKSLLPRHPQLALRLRS